MSETKNIKMTDGPILSAVIRYSLPIVFAGMLQILFNAADLAVVGHFAGSAATAAVGATGSTISLIVNTVMGLAVGVNVVLARSLGTGDRENSKRTVHTAIAVSVIAGIAVMIVGILISRPAMVYTRCPQDALEQAVQYMIIYFAGSPAIFVYNFGSAILRTKGDTKHPLYYLTAAGVFNIFLNLIFVIVFRMAAAGVALATTLTQYLAAFLTIRCLMRQDDECRFVLRETHIWKSQLIGIIRYGLPSGITQAMYSISNIQIQSAINDFGTSAVAGNSASSNLEGFISAGIAGAQCGNGRLCRAEHRCRQQEAREEGHVRLSCRFGCIFAYRGICGVFLQQAADRCDISAERPGRGSLRHGQGGVHDDDDVDIRRLPGGGRHKSGTGIFNGNDDKFNRRRLRRQNGMDAVVLSSPQVA